MDLVIRQSCPSCGAPLELHEADRLIRCSFCEVHSFMVPKGVLRFVLPDHIPTEILPDDIRYYPYLRFKGNIYYCTAREIGHKIIDTTQCGFTGADLPASLGLRAQAMTLFPVTGRLQGRFVRKNTQAREIFAKAVRLSHIGREKKSGQFLHTSFIGETLSIIYFPTYKKDDQWYDGVLGRPLVRQENRSESVTDTLSFQDHWVPGFIPSICPGCGDTLHGEPDSVVLFCRNCLRSYQEDNGRFVSLDWEIVTTEGNDICYLPFWKLRVEVRGVEMKSFGDLLRLTHQPLVVQRCHDTAPPTFIVPAFKIRPKTFLRLAGVMTLAQLQIAGQEAAMADQMHPVTLPGTEAEQAVKAVLAALTINKRKVLPLYPGITIRTQKRSLLYLPFRDQGHDLLHRETGASLVSSVLRFGRRL